MACLFLCLKYSKTVRYTNVTPLSVVACVALYQDALGLPLEAMNDYRLWTGFPVANHVGVWPLAMVAQSCFGQDEWPIEFAEPASISEFELADAAAVCDMKDRGRSLFTTRARSHGGRQSLALSCVDWTEFRALAA